MRIISLTEFKRSTYEFLDVLKNGKERIFVRGRGNEFFELIPAERVTEDGVYFANEGVKERLNKSLQSARAGDVEEIGLGELKTALGVE